MCLDNDKKNLHLCSKHVIAMSSRKSKEKYHQLVFSEVCLENVQVIYWRSCLNSLSSLVIGRYGVVCDPSGRSDVCCFVRSVLNERRENRRMAAKNMSGRDALSPAEEENLISEDNESANSSPQGTDNVLANVLSTMTQMSSTMLSHEKGNETVS